MVILYKGERFNGIFFRQGAYSGGNSHFVLNGKMLCPSGLNFHANDLIIRKHKPTVTNCKNLVPHISCKKCAKKLTELIAAKEANQTQPAETN